VGAPLVASHQEEASLGQAGVEDEVKRLVARELHDRVAQTLTGMLVDVENFKSEQVSWQDVLRQLDLIQSSTRQVLQSLRQLLHDLRGEELIGDDGFVEAIQVVVDRFAQTSDIAAELEVGSGWPEKLPPGISLNLYRIVEEALANVRRHSDARSAKVAVEVLSDGELSLRIEDDGRGVDTDPSRVMGLGTVGMRERAVLIGGRLTVESEGGRGTTVTVVFRNSEVAPLDPTPGQPLIVRASA
jgi:two-component system, NarL family, sensor histidine kinase UhpB